MEDKDEDLSLMNLTAEFVKTLNSSIQSFNLKDISEVEQIQLLQQRIAKVMNLFEKSEENASVLLKQLGKSINECKDVVYIRKEGNLRAIVSRDIIKPVIRPVTKLEIECDCIFEVEERFEESKGYFSVETEEDLRKLDNMLSTVIVSVFDHKYRSYEPFTCIISLYVPAGFIYIIDAIKFRDIIPSLKLFRCGINKIFTSQFDVQRIFEDFGSCGCYKNFNIPHADLFVDWRIRPINETFNSIMCDIMIKTAEKINLQLPTECYKPVKCNEIEDFMEEFDLSELSADIVEDLLKLREYLARNNDEGVQYVMTNKQLYNLIVNMPTSLEEFESLFERMSSVLRLHAGDFLIILKRKSKIFSLENLKCKQEVNKDETKDDRLDYCTIEESQESDLEISEE